MLGLRLAEGLSLSTLAEDFGEKTLERIWACLQPYYLQGWVEIVTPSAEVLDIDAKKLPTVGQLRLNDPDGFLFSNTILADLFSELG
jgi:oxygen-independent coproporphyrinogen-3 oxidase